MKSLFKLVNNSTRIIDSRFAGAFLIINNSTRIIDSRFAGAFLINLVPFTPYLSVATLTLKYWLGKG